MSATPSIDAYDAQMLDFSLDPDVPMHVTGSTEFLAEALMDHDGHLSVSTYAEHASVEVDMEEYVGDNEEYEMADETAEYQPPHGDELLDIEVYDASHVPSPLVSLQPLQPSVDVPIESEQPASAADALSEHTALQGERGSELHIVPPDHSLTDAVNPSPSGEGVSEVVALEPAHSTDAPDESLPPVSESCEQLGETTTADEHPLEASAPTCADDETEPRYPPVVEECPANSEVAHHENPEPPIAELAPLTSTEDAHDPGLPVQSENTADPTPATEGETVDPLHISDDVYIDPPPTVLLSVADFSVPGFALFNQPQVATTSTEEADIRQKVYSLLLENRPTLYYEPLSSVFEALRQDEGLLSRIPHSFEGELVLEAYDLHLAISEDNVHAREISLHDLNILHDGSDFVGPLRILLRAVVPRFIMRFYALQEQIQRNLSIEPGGGRHDGDQQDHYDTGEEHSLVQLEESVSTQAVVASEGLGVSLAPENSEEFVKESVLAREPTNETPPEEESYEQGDASNSQEPSAEYHKVTGDATHVPPDEDEDDYEATNAGDEDESAESESLDTGRVHETTVEDTPTTVPGHVSEFRGEQTEYYVQSEEYDERYVEEVPERAEGASPVQYDEPQQCKGERDASTPVDETQADLPDEEEQSATTPIPSRAILEPELGETIEDGATEESTQAEQEHLVPELAAGESTNEVADTVHVSDNYKTSDAQAKLFLEVEESDTNFVSILEREADTEFDRTFSTEQSVQEVSIDATLQHDETWDEWDDEDAEGEDEENWIDPDAASNESSVTLSSKASSKRSFDEIDFSEEVYAEDPRSSPGSKRPRVQ